MTPAVSMQDFKSTRRLVTVPAASGEEVVLTYWNNADPLPSLEEALHIKCDRNEGYYLEIANMKYEGSLDELEEVLYTWALNEGWFD